MLKPKRITKPATNTASVWNLGNTSKEISKETFEKAERGQEISLATAEKICKPLGIKVKDYFDIITTRKPFAKATINSYRKSLCATLSSAKRQRLIAHNYASRDYIETPNGTKRNTIILNEKESIKLAEELEKEENIIIKTSLMACLYMGIRRSELAGLQWQDIDLENNVMKIQRSMHSTKGIGKSTKTESSKREVSMPQALTEQLKEYKIWWDEHRPYFIDPKFKDALFKKDTLMPYNPSIFITWLRKILEQAGLTKVTLHSLRHTNISLQLMEGIDIKTVAGRVGHSQTSTTTDIYSHFLQSSDKKASNILDKIFK
jgi:integrase